MANVYETCYYGGMIVAILLLIVTIILFFVLKIPRVVGELTGSSARREVKSLKAKGTRKASDVNNEPRHYSQRTGAIKTRTTDAPSEELAKRENTTGSLIRGRDRKRRPYHMDENQTEFLGESKITAAVTGDIAETAVLSQNDVESDSLEFVNTDNLKSEKPSKEDMEVSSVVDASSNSEVEASEDANNPDVSENVENIEDVADEATEVLADATEKTEDASIVDAGQKKDVADEEAKPSVSDETDDEATEFLASDDVGDDEATEVLASDDADDDEATEVLASDDADDDEATEVLASDDADDDEATEVLASDDADDDEATEVLTSDDYDDDEATAVLTSDAETNEYGETSVLSVGETKIKVKNYVVLYNVMEVHTSEKL